MAEYIDYSPSTIPNTAVAVGVFVNEYRFSCARVYASYKTTKSYEVVMLPREERTISIVTDGYDSYSLTWLKTDSNLTVTENTTGNFIELTLTTIGEADAVLQVLVEFAGHKAPIILRIRTVATPLPL